MDPSREGFALSSQGDKQNTFMSQDFSVVSHFLCTTSEKRALIQLKKGPSVILWKSMKALLKGGNLLPPAGYSIEGKEVWMRNFFHNESKGK